MAHDITPALTPEQWSRLAPDEWVFPDAIGVSDPNPIKGADIGRLRHHVAAVSLYGQSFGFTTDDVSWLRALANNWAIDLNALEAWASSLSSRIAALLPPEPR